MRSAIYTFRENISSVKTLHELHRVFNESIPALDLSEILRAELVMAVSALDCYLHDIVIINMSNITFQDVDITSLPSAYKDFPIRMQYAKQILTAENVDEQKQLIQLALVKSLHEFSFESSRTVEKALSYIGVRHIWTNLADRLNRPSNDIKKELDIIIHRRNIIAHQADIVDRTSGEKQSISREEIDPVIRFIENFVLNIDAIVEEQIASA